MFIADKLLCLQLQKTGSSHIGQVLDQVLDGRLVGKHEPLTNRDRQLLEGRIVAGSLRHPLDWYVSLWAYSCSGKGEIYDRTAGKAIRHSLSLLFKHQQRGWRGLINEGRKPRHLWRALYENPDSADHFRRWFELLHTQYRDAWTVALLDVEHDWRVGLYTHWLIRCYTVRTPGRARPVSGSDLIVEKYIRLEHQARDLAHVLREAGYPTTVVDSAKRVSEVVARNRSNHRPVDHYYTRAMLREVASMDRVIFELGKYEV